MNLLIEVGLVILFDLFEDHISSNPTAKFNKFADVSFKRTEYKLDLTDYFVKLFAV